MQKILRILGTIVTTGTTMPTIIATSPYKKLEQANNLGNGEINYQQTSKLENLNRSKRNNILNDVYYLTGENYINKQNILPYPTTTMYTFSKNKYDRSIGDIYFGTTNGIYLRKNGQLAASRINGINGIIAEIKDINDNYNAVGRV